MILNFFREQKRGVMLLPVPVRVDAYLRVTVCQFAQGVENGSDRNGMPGGEIVGFTGLPFFKEHSIPPNHIPYVEKIPPGIQVSNLDLSGGIAGGDV